MVLKISYELEIKKEKNFVYAYAKGKKTVESIKETTKKISEACDKYNYLKALVDVRDFTETLNMSEIFSLASTDLTKIINHRIKKAALLVKDDNDDNKQFFENVSTYWEHNVKLFIDINDAKKWLI